MCAMLSQMTIKLFTNAFSGNYRLYSGSLEKCCLNNIPICALNVMKVKCVLGTHGKVKLTAYCSTLLIHDFPQGEYCGI